jgi:hypothetical protein
VKYKCCEERKCIISCWKNKNKNRGMGWVKYKILEDQE